MFKTNFSGHKKFWALTPNISLWLRACRRVYLAITAKLVLEWGNAVS